MNKQPTALDGSNVAQRVSFAAATGITGYLLWKCMKPPRPVRLETARDRFGSIGLVRAAFAGLALYRTCLLGLSGLNAVAAVAGPPYTQAWAGLAPYADQVDAKLVSWNATSASVLAAIAAAAATRLHAMDELGVNFTFDLHDPDRLVTSGMYRFVQHPSYTTAVVASVLGSVWFLRPDGAIGSFLPPYAYDAAARWRVESYVIAIACLLWGVRRRVMQEEEMLRAKFGREWEEWNRRTARFIPFLI